MTNINNNASATIAEAARSAAQAGDEAYLHVSHIGPLEVRSVETVDNSTDVVNITCWSSDDSSTTHWIVPVHLIHGLEVREGRRRCA